MWNPVTLLPLLIVLAGCAADLAPTGQPSGESLSENQPSGESPSNSQPDHYLDYAVTTSKESIDAGFPWLFDNEIQPFVDVTDYGHSPLIPGDSVRISYQGEIQIKETWPATADLSQAKITGVEVYEARVYEFTVKGADLFENDEKTIYGLPETIYLDDWQGYNEGAEVLEDGMTVYGINPAAFNSFNCVYFCLFNPRG